MASSFCGIPKLSWLFYFMFVFWMGHCKQVISKEVLTIGYTMKPSREEDFAKVCLLKQSAMY